MPLLEFVAAHFNRIETLQYYLPPNRIEIPNGKLLLLAFGFPYRIEIFQPSLPCFQNWIETAHPYCKINFNIGLKCFSLSDRNKYLKNRIEISERDIGLKFGYTLVENLFKSLGLKCYCACS